MNKRFALNNTISLLGEYIRKRKTLLLTLSAMVVFVTTYMLILPALTLEEDEAARQGGIDVPASEQIVASDASGAKAGPAFAGDGYTISLEAGNSAKLPENTELTAAEVAPDDKDYEAWCDEALKALQESSSVKEDISGLKSARFYDITLLADGSVVEPKDAVGVTISYDKSIKMENKDDVKVIHFGVDKRGNLKPEVLKDSAVSVKASKGKKKGTIEVSDVAFDTTGFSMYGVVETSVYEKTIMTADGKTYKVTVTAGADAQIPQDAELEVSEVTESDADYQAYADETADALGTETKDLGYSKFLDITIVSEGNSVQPQAPVDVQIQMLDRDTSGDVQVVHFGEEREVLDSSTEGDTVSFKADGFSIYAVVDGEETGDNARIGYRFWYNDGSQNMLLSTQYFRYKDVHPSSGDALTINEPSIPNIDSATWSRIFRGWSKTSFNDDDANLTSVEVLNNELSEKASGDYVEGTYVDLYANLKNVYYVTYVDINPNNVLATEIIPVAESGDTKFDVKSDSELRPTIDSDTELLGWYDINAPETVYDPGQKNVVVDSSITLYPKVEGGNWLIFNDNDPVWDAESQSYVSGGASFTPPAFYLDSVTKAPADPVWAGYEFGGWYTDPNCTTPFEFGQDLTHDTTVYAKWTPSASQYRVIYWKQRATDDWDAADSEKTYDYADSRLVNTGVVTGQVVDLDPADTKVYGSGGSSGEADQSYFTYNANKTDQSITVAADGSSVLNVYYDRQVITINFSGNLYHYEETTDTTGELYAYVNGQYVRVYPDGNGGYETRETVTRTETVTHHYDGTRYNTTTQSYAQNNNQYGVENSSVVKLKWHNGMLYDYWWTTNESYGSRYTGTRYTINDNGRYGFVDGSMIILDSNGDYTTTETITETTTTPYTGDVYKRVTQNGLTLKGLYGRSMYPGEWPTALNGTTEGWWRFANNNGGNTTLNAPWNSYRITPAASADQINNRTWNLTRTTKSSGQTIYYYGEDINGNYTILLAETERASNSLTVNSEKFYGYETAYWTYGINGDHHDLNGGATSISTSYYSTSTPLYIYYSREKYDLTFYTNNGNNRVDVIADVPYEKSLEEYAEHSEGQRTGYYFLGWYADPSCSEPFDFTQTMPHSNVAVYGNWKLRRVRVVIDPGATNVYMGSQATRFRLDYDERIDGGLLESATRAGYILDGWYTDPDFTNRFLFSSPINDDTSDIAWDYQDSHRWDAERAAYGDDTENYDNVRGILHLYAKWIPDTSSTGINVVYDPGDAAIYDTVGNLLTTVPVDSHMYTFEGTATTREAPSNYSDLYTFKYWEATLKDGSTKIFYSSDPITLDTLMPSETIYDETTGEELRHTVTLRAVYDLTGDPSRKTTITYDGDTFNDAMYDGSTKQMQGRANDGTQRITITLDKEVNQNIELPTADDFYLDGWELVGWSFTEGTYEQQVAAATEDAPNFQPGQTVAADNLIISDLNDKGNTLYAMWRPKTYNVTVRQVIEDGVPVNSFTYPYKTGEEREIGSATESTKTLTGNSSFGLENLGYYERTGDVIHITTPSIPESASYSVRVNAVVTHDDGTTEILHPTESGDYRILGNVVITYTYSQKVLVKLQKRDSTNHSTALTGASFVITPVEFNTSTQHWEDAGEGITVTITGNSLEQYLQEGTYRITETVAPANHALISTDLYMTVNKDQPFTLFTASGGQVSADIAELDADNDTLTVYDDPIHTVTLGKTAEDESATEFTFKVTVYNNNNGRLRNYTIGQFDGNDLTTNNVGEISIRLKHNDTVGLKIPHGCKITVEEQRNPMYEPQYSWSGDTSSEPVKSNIFGQEPVPITDDSTLAFYNALAAVPVTLQKVGIDNTEITPSETPLAGATFTIYTTETGSEVAKDINGRALQNLTASSETGKVGIFFDGTLKVGTYYLEETEIPAGYYAPQGRFELKVSAATAPTIKATWITGSSTSNYGTVTGDRTNGYMVTVRNVAGVELPSTGGLGTHWIYILGSILLLGCGVTLIGRRRIRNHS